MTFTLKSLEFNNAFENLKITVNQGVNSTNPEIKFWALEFSKIEFVFNKESVEQLENNLVETTKWNLLNLADAYADNKNDQAEFLKVSAVIMSIYLKEAYFRIGAEQDALKIRKFYEAIYDLKNREYKKYRIYFDFLEQLPYLICREIYNNSKLNEIRNFLEEKDFSTFNEFLHKADIATQVINDWELKFDEKTDEVKALGLKLDNYKTSYDFVLLNEGFKKLYDQKIIELEKVKSTYSLMAASMFIVPLLEFSFLAGLLVYFKGNLPSNIWWLSIPFLTMLIVLFYLVRIHLQEKRSVQSQMMQLELRMALCQFIHNYAEDSEKLHKKNQAGFEKFENIIFSPLVSSDDKIPTTFDGMEQLAKLIGEFRKN